MELNNIMGDNTKAEEGSIESLRVKVGNKIKELIKATDQKDEKQELKIVTELIDTLNKIAEKLKQKV